MKYARSDIIEISSRGVVTIPKKYRDKLGLHAGGKAIISFNEELAKFKSFDKKKRLLTTTKAIEQQKTKK